MDSASIGGNYVQPLVECTEKGYLNVTLGCIFYGVRGDKFMGLLVLHCCLWRVVFLVSGQTDSPIDKIEKLVTMTYYYNYCVSGHYSSSCFLFNTVEATHIESSASRSARTTAAQTPIGSRAVSVNV
jgi:hypothetical protein